MEMYMHIKYGLVLVALLLLTGCEDDKNNTLKKKDGYNCIVRVELAWSENFSRYERDNILLQFGDDGLFKSDGKDFIAFILNNNDELIHIDYTNDIKCNHKYKETQRILDTYLKPLKNSPKYKVIEKTLEKDEFDDLEVKYSYSNPKS